MDQAIYLLTDSLPYEFWRQDHAEKLNELYYTVMGKIGKLPLLDTDDENMFDNFCIFIYNSSSKKRTKTF